MGRAVCVAGAAATAAALMTSSPARASCNMATLDAYYRKIVSASEYISTAPSLADSLLRGYFRDLAYCVDTTHTARERWAIAYLQEIAEINVAAATVNEGRFSSARAIVANVRRKLRQYRTDAGGNGVLCPALGNSETKRRESTTLPTADSGWRR